MDISDTRLNQLRGRFSENKCGLTNTGDGSLRAMAGLTLLTFRESPLDHIQRQQTDSSIFPQIISVITSTIDCTVGDRTTGDQTVTLTM